MKDYKLTDKITKKKQVATAALLYRVYKYFFSNLFI